MEAFAAERRTHRGNECKLPKIIARLDPDDQAIVKAWLADPDVEHAHIARTLTRIGHPIQGQSVGRHRGGNCQCDESAVS
jgi:hypothetical protein